MKAKIYSIDGKSKGEIDLPIHFSEPIRKDLIRRAFLAKKSTEFQPQGVDPLAGKRKVVELRKRRRVYRTTYGYGQSRTPRKVLWRIGSRFGWVGAFVPFARGGRTAHPPKVEKVIVERINKKENRKAIRSAIAAAKSIFVEDKAEDLEKTKDVEMMLKKLNLMDLIERAKEKKVRAGRGKMRGRKYKKRKSVLFVVGKPNSKLLKAAKNLAGVDVVNVKKLNVKVLAPGGNPGRTTIWTQSAIEKLKEGLFI